MFNLSEINFKIQDDSWLKRIKASNQKISRCKVENYRKTTFFTPLTASFSIETA
jgi:hypothetical protein